MTLVNNTFCRRSFTHHLTADVCCLPRYIIFFPFRQLILLVLSVPELRIRHSSSDGGSVHRQPDSLHAVPAQPRQREFNYRQRLLTTELAASLKS